MIPLSVPNFEGNEEKYVLDAVSQGWVSTAGEYVKRLETMIASYISVPAAAACQSGTAALHLSLIECGVRAGDLVIVPTLTFIAAVNPVRYLQADPAFMDCDDSLCMAPEKLKEFCEKECRMTKKGLMHLESRKIVRAVVVVHVFGNLADMDAIMDIAEKYSLKVIEDATEALGSYFEVGKYAGRMAGSIGDFGAYSFNGNKIITTGGGGMAVSRSGQALEHLKYLSVQAKDDARFYIHDEIGYNYRMTNVQAALGVAQMEKLEKFIRRKNENYEMYCRLLGGTDRYYMLRFRENCRTNKWFYSLVLNRKYLRDDIRTYVQKLENRGVQTRPVWGLIHEQKPYRNSISYRIETAKYYSERIINLPCSTGISIEEIETVSEQIEEAFKN